MTTQKLIKALNDHNITHDTEPNPTCPERPTIHAHCYAHSDDYDTLQVDENGALLINGKLDGLREWLGY